MNNDLISREALRNVILNDRKLDGANANWEVNRILVHIDNAPTVSPEPTSDLIKAFELLKAHCKELQKAHCKNQECNKDCVFYRELKVGDSTEQFCGLCEIVTSDERGKE